MGWAESAWPFFCRDHMHYIEIRRWQRRSSTPFFVPLDAWQSGYEGFRSVYAYTADVQAMLTQPSHLREESPSVYSDVLFVDFDNTDPTESILYLFDNDYAFEVWDSGGRSTHLHVPIVPMEGEEAPHSQKKWVSEHCPGADLTFYNPVGLFRLPGTMHEKTGRRKLPVSHRAGNILEIPKAAKPPVVLASGVSTRSGLFMSHLLKRKSEGGRRVYVWHLAKQARAEGLDFEAAVKHILWWNERYATPALPTELVREKCYEVYASRAKERLVG